MSGLGAKMRIFAVTFIASIGRSAGLEKFPFSRDGIESWMALVGTERS